MLKLEETALAIGPNVVVDGRSTGRNRFLQHLPHRVVQPLEFIPRERGGPAARTHPRAKEGLVGVDVANATQELLVEQRGLDRRLALAEKRHELFEREVQRLDAA